MSFFFRFKTILKLFICVSFKPNKWDHKFHLVNISIRFTTLTISVTMNIVYIKQPCHLMKCCKCWKMIIAPSNGNCLIILYLFMVWKFVIVIKSCYMIQMRNFAWFTVSKFSFNHLLNVFLSTLLKCLHGTMWHGLWIFGCGMWMSCANSTMWKQGGCE